MSSELLSEAEQRAMQLTVDLVNVVAQEVIGFGRTRDNDMREFVHHVHAIQHAIMSQAAVRAYPSQFRPLGGVL